MEVPMGIEPMNVGFANRSVRPLRHGTTNKNEIIVSRFRGFTRVDRLYKNRKLFTICSQELC